MNNLRNLQARRQFLKKVAATSVMGCGIAAMNGKLGLMGNAMAAAGDYGNLSDYKALVCIFLYGGSDSFNMFVPTEQARYDNYINSRGNLAIDKDTLLMPLVDAGFGFNTNMSNCNEFYNNGKLAVVSNVGNLITPVTREHYQNNKAIPADLFAHNHQQEQWLKGISSQPSSIVSSGWGGRMADLLIEANNGAELPPTFSLNGSNHWLPGNASTPLTLNPNFGLTPMSFMDVKNGGNQNSARADTLAQILALQRTHALEQQAAIATARGIDASGALLSALEQNENFNTPYNSGSKLGAQLRMVARLIAGQSDLNMQRQIFFVGMGGWDTHDNQAIRFDSLVSELDQGLADFYATLEEIGKQDQVTSFTASDFGRTLTINGDGSDHGWGGHYMVLGGAVNGGQLLGQLPSYLTGADDDAGDKGRVIPEMSINQFGASLGQWMGLSNSDLSEIFPDLANFDSSWQDEFSLFI